MRSTFTRLLVVASAVGAFCISWELHHPAGARAAGPVCTVGASGADYTTIQAAVNDGGCATINVAAGTYVENVLVNRAVTINGAGPRSGATVVDGGGLSPAFVFGEPGDGSCYGSPLGFAATLSRMTLTNGRGPGGCAAGGAIHNNATLTLDNVTVSGNHGFAGGVYGDGPLTVKGSTFSGNTASNGYGGAIRANAATTIVNSTFNNNGFPYDCSVSGICAIYATAYGGAITSGAQLTVVNSTIAGNLAIINGSAIMALSGSVTMKNTVVADNVGTNQCGGAVIDAGHNLDSGSTCGFSAVNGSLSNADASLGPLQDNGGPTDTLALLAGSQAIDAGDGSACAAPPVSNLDQRGVTRSQGTACDIGAYEAAASAVCTPPPAGLVGWWPGDGDAADIVGGHNGTLLNGATFAPGEVGQAFTFTTDGQVVAVPDAPELSFGPTSPMTVALWAYRTGAGVTQHVLGRRLGCTGAPYLDYINYQMAIGGSKLEFGAGPGNAVQTLVDLPLNTWTHLAATFDGATFSFYMDGALIGTGNGILGSPAAANLKIGGSGDCGGTFQGQLDEVQIFNRALSQAEVQAIFDAGSAGQCHNQPVTPSITWQNPADITYPTALDGTQLNASADVPGTFAYTLAAGTVLNAGSGQSLSVLFTPTDTTNYTTASKTVQINVLQGSQTITASWPPTAAVDTTFYVTATASSGLPVAIGASGACTANGTAITTTSATGTCTVTFDQSGNANYLAAPQVVGTTTVQSQQTSQSITFGPLAAKTYGDASFTVSAVASSGLAVSFSSDTAARCTVTGNTVTIVAAGLCTIRASQGGDANYAAAADVTQSFTIGQASQTIVFGALAAKQVDDPDFAVSATGGASGQPVTFTAAGNCTVAGNSVHITGAGSCTITAHQAGDANYLAAADVPQTFDIIGAGVTVNLRATLQQLNLSPGSYSGGVLASAGLTLVANAPDTPGAPGTGTLNLYAANSPNEVHPPGTGTEAFFFGPGIGYNILNCTTLAWTGSGSLTAFTITRPGTINFASIPAWAMYAYAADGTLLSSAGEGDIVYGSYLFTNGHYADFTISSATPIARVVFCSHNGYSTYNALPLSGGALTSDQVPPNTTVDTGPSSPTNATTASFTFSGTDDVTASASLIFECQLDGGGFSVCASPTTYTSLAEGPHTFSVRAKDAAGNVDPTPATFSWSIDTSPPHTILDAMPVGDPTSQTTALFTFHSTEPNSTFECSLDSISGGAFAPCSSGVQYSGLTDGVYTFQVRAIDEAGNPDVTPATFSWTVDTQAPDTVIDTAPADPTSSNTATFGLHASEGATFTCQLDAQPASACATGVTYNGLGDGTHTFTVTATDPAGNVDQSPASFTWVVDTVAPDTSIAAGPDDGSTTTSTTATFQFAGTDDRTAAANLTFECSLDAAPFASCTSGVTYTGLTRAPHTFAVRAKDAAGNLDQSPASRAWTIETLTPVLTWANPADITYPTPLGGAQLNATADVPGAFAYTPPAGTVLGAGTAQTLSVLFTPTDTVNYRTASTTVQINVLTAGQTITVTTPAPGSAVFGASFNVAATASSSLGVAVTTTGGCSGGGTGSATITMTSGTTACVVHYNQGGDSNYAGAVEVMSSTTAQKAGQTITVTQAGPASASYNTSFNVAATASSGLGVAITTTGSCSGSGTGSATITMTNATGTCSVRYNQAGDANYLAAPQVSQTTTAQKASQTITVTQGPPPTAVFNTSFPVAATASSGLAVTVTASGACSRSGSTVTMTSGTGTCTVTFTQGGNGNYLAAPQVSQTTTAQKASQVITVTQGAPATKVYNTSFTVAATAPGGTW